jgi:hypothetical protein
MGIVSLVDEMGRTMFESRLSMLLSLAAIVITQDDYRSSIPFEETFMSRDGWC